MTRLSVRKSDRTGGLRRPAAVRASTPARDERRCSKITFSTPSAWAVNSAVECYPHTVEVRGSNPLPPTITAEHCPPRSFYLKIEVTFNETDIIYSATIHPPVWKSRDGAGRALGLTAVRGERCVITADCLPRRRGAAIERFVPQSAPVRAAYDPLVVVWRSGDARRDYA